MSEGASVDLSLFSLEGRTAVITGASRNIGAAVSMGFAAAGADVVLVARNQQRLAAHGAAIRERTGRRVVEVSVDVGAPNAAEIVAEAAGTLPGTVDILMNNAYAGAPDLTPLVETPESLWEEVLAVNLVGPWRFCRQFAPQLPQAATGRSST